MRRGLSFLLLSVTLVAGCGHTMFSSVDGWRAVKTKHFTFYTSTRLLYSTTLAAAEHSYSAVASSFFQGADVGNVDVLFLENEDFGALLGYKRHVAVLAKVPGNGRIGQNGLVVLQTDPTGRTVHGPLMHLFMQKRVPHAPLWLHEGMAGYAGTMVVMAGNGQVACFGRPMGSRDPLIPLDQLFTLSWDQFADGPQSWYHHTAAVLVDFILHGDKDSYRPRLDGIVQRVSEGEPAPAVFAAVFPEMTLEALNTRISGHSRDLQYISGSPVRGRCPMGFDIPPDNIADPEQRQITPVPAADMSTLIDAIKKLPRRDDGYPAWYPPEVIARVEKGELK
jgi:hypothetical protein